MVGRQDCLRAVGSDLLVASVVEEDYATAVNLRVNLCFYLSSGRGTPVVGGDIPHDGFEAEFTGNAKNRGTTSAERRAEEIDRLADGVFDCGTTRG